MRFHYDLGQATPVIKDLLVYDGTTLVAGEAVCGVALTDTNGAGGVESADVDALIDMIGIMNETAPNSVSVVAEGVDYYGKVIVNPLAVYQAEYDTTNGPTVQTADSTGHNISDSTIDAYQVGGWHYVYGPTTDTAYGNLMRIGAQTSTTTLTGVTGSTYDDELGANTTSSTYILIRKCFNPGLTGDNIDLNTAATKIDADIDSLGDAIVLENYVNHTRFSMDPLRTARHSGKNIPGATFYGDLYFTDHLLRGASTIA